MFAFVYDARTRKREYGELLNTVTVRAPDDSFIVPTFVYDASPCRTRRFVRLELRDQDATLISLSTTKAYRSCPPRRKGRS